MSRKEFPEDEEDDESLSDFDFDEDEDLEEEFSTTEERADEEPEEELPPPLEEAPAAAASAMPSSSKEETEEEALVSPADLPVSLKIELGRVRLTADRLLHLKPGNFLELNRSIDQGVDLVVNGAKVGRGELIRIGEAIGVRILELGQ